ncbi:Pescadillo N-terminus family protein [Trichomonas vaginalis G3]|uniref:Pescadillo homolog n=1 Tax=Trichomonas vaginalis (strain ATCC PRA-98 / G3) TaxID=412133 RepID=A2DN41_TRIV3|nr:pescadillo family [Trichomonas vaginalis G3]EAY18218.1 Pescadillo N-terminus family protein [Trichomonas vaginalis G3]KAI5491523.1 pescadillo family [Trichomonas vaginalis G3]|eukprot:XP_001579204.1 Pescadillo N-terminus family protein [Trichomonas vaginalis G3]
MVKLPFQKGKEGKSSNLVKEDEAIERVALDPKDMGRMAILRGVYPKVSPKDKNSPWAYFHKKDLQMINSDPMAWFIRDHANWLKHHEKRYNRKELDQTPEPVAPYDQLIRSRYPTFADAIKDLDDALTTVALFAQMSGSDILDSARVLKCRHLLAEFHYYVSHKHLLTKGFISKRGFHFEAQIEGLPVVWLIPHQFTLSKDPDVDYTVLLNFLELYENLLSFVNLRLFKLIGLKYPPEYDQKKWDSGFYIDAIIDNNEQPVVESVAEAPADAKVDMDKVAGIFAKAAAETVENDEEKADSGVFGNYVFTIGRETPRDALALIIRSLGGRIIWDESSKDTSITHTITDRKVINERVLSRKYIQPQWVFDCLNKHSSLDCAPYQPGQVLPPHLSPWDAPVQPEAPEEIDDREVLADDDDDENAEISSEIRQRAMEIEHAEGIAQELGVAKEQTETLEDLKQKKKQMKEKKKEERERLLAGTLPARKAKIYHELKEKEDAKLKKKKGAAKEDADTVRVNEEAMEEEEK